MNARPSAPASPVASARFEPGANAELFPGPGQLAPRASPPSPAATAPPRDHPAAAREAADSAACLRCGVCCFSRLDTYVRVTGDDWTRLGPDAERHAHFIGHRAYLKMHDGRCAALALRPDPATGATHFFCTIYDRRPQTCRDLSRGSPECEGEIALKAGRPAGR